MAKMRIGWIILLIMSLNLLIKVTADQVFPAYAGGTFGSGSLEPKYKIEFHSEDSPFHPPCVGACYNMNRCMLICLDASDAIFP